MSGIKDLVMHEWPWITTVVVRSVVLSPHLNYNTFEAQITSTPDHNFTQ